MATSFPAREIARRAVGDAVGAQSAEVRRRRRSRSSGASASPGASCGGIKPDAVVGFGGYPVFPPFLAARHARHSRHPARAERRDGPRQPRARPLRQQDRAELRARRSMPRPSRPRRCSPAIRCATACAPSPTRPIRRSTADGPIAARGLRRQPGRARLRRSRAAGDRRSCPKRLRQRLRIVQQCRPEDLDRVAEAYRQAKVNVELQPFFTDLPERMAHAHLVIGRAGRVDRRRAHRARPAGDPRAAAGLDRRRPEEQRAGDGGRRRRLDRGAGHAFATFARQSLDLTFR